MLVSNLIVGLSFVGINEANSFSSSVWRILLKRNQESITKISVEYGNDDLKEETRILVEEIGLRNFQKLNELKLKMNRCSYLDQICDYLPCSEIQTLSMSENYL